MQSTIKEIFLDYIPKQICMLPRVEYLSSLSLQTLKGHSNSVESVVFPPDGQTLASGPDDSTIKIWDAKTGTGQQTLKGHSSSITSEICSKYFKI
jgi:WD40 repeat protein